MAYLTISGNKNIDVTREEAQAIRAAMHQVAGRPDTVEVSGHLIKLSSIREVYFEEEKKEDNRFYEQILQWEREIREMRERSVTGKVNLNRSIVSLMWKACHASDMDKPKDYIPDKVWEKWEAIARDFFARHPKRIHVDTFLWLDLMKPAETGLLGERIAESVVNTIHNERILAVRDGEPQDSLPDAPGSLKSPENPENVQKPSVGSLASVGDILESKAPPTRTRNPQEDNPKSLWDYPADDIKVEHIPF